MCDVILVFLKIISQAHTRDNKYHANHLHEQIKMDFKVDWTLRVHT